jgi:hypothetical protein
MFSSTIFIGLVIVAVTQIVKEIFPQVSGALTIILAMVIGVLASLFGVTVGIDQISVAQGVAIALASVGAHTVASAAAPTVTPVVGPAGAPGSSGPLQ